MFSAWWWSSYLFETCFSAASPKRAHPKLRPPHKIGDRNANSYVVLRNNNGEFSRLAIVFESTPAVVTQFRLNWKRFPYRRGIEIVFARRSVLISTTHARRVFDCRPETDNILTIMTGAVFRRIIREHQSLGRRYA